MKRTRLRKVGKSPVKLCKTRIQALLRALAIKRDKVCVLSHYPETGKCGGYGKKSGKLILQAEHLNSRERNFSFGDMRNIILLCKRHHFYFKKKQGVLYWKLIEKSIGKKRWAWVEQAVQDTKPYKMNLSDWQLLEVGLQQDLIKEIEKNNPK